MLSGEQADRAHRKRGTGSLGRMLPAIKPQPTGIVSGEILATSVLEIHPSRLDKCARECAVGNSPATASGKMIQQGLFQL